MGSNGDPEVLGGARQAEETVRRVIDRWRQK